MKNESHKPGTGYCTKTFIVEDRIIENNYRCNNKALEPSQLEKIQNGSGKLNRRKGLLTIY